MPPVISHRRSEAGFSLVEFVIVIGIFGVLLASALAMIKPYLEMARRNATIKKQEQLAIILSEYALNNGRLPCPADPANTGTTPPYGYPRNSWPPLVAGGPPNALNACHNVPSTTVWNGTTHGPDYVGILPFRTLGLTEDQVTDAWGNLMTYAVSPALAQDMNTGTTHMVHDHCRSISWTGAVWRSGGDVMNRRKAMLCCSYDAGHRDVAGTPGSINSDIVVRDALAGNPIFSGYHQPFSTYAYSGTDASGVDDGNDPSWPWDTWYGNTQMIAYAIISHGRNGDGAFVRGSATQRPVTANPLAEESENRDNDLVFVDRPFSTVNDTGYFDDLILWRTNGQLVAATGTNTCARP